MVTAEQVGQAQQVGGAFGHELPELLVSLAHGHPLSG
jgi:hypothetical protein